MEGAANPAKPIDGRCTDFVLQNLCFSARSLRHGVTSELTSHVLLKLREGLHNGDKTLMVRLAYKMLSVINDAEYSSLWMQLLEGLCGVRDNSDVAAIYSYLNEKQIQIFESGSLPVPFLHYLWLSDLPSLECAVLTLVKHVCSSISFLYPSVIVDAIEKSHLADVASKEPVIYQTVYSMLETLTLDTDSDCSLILDVLALFCQIVQKKMDGQIHMFRECCVSSPTLSNFESVLRSNSVSMSSSSVLNTLHNLHKMWTSVGESTDVPGNYESYQVDHFESLKNIPYPEAAASGDVKDRLSEGLWHLTIRYRQWIFSAHKNILSCDLKYLPPCLWIIAAHHRLGLDSSDCETPKSHLNNFISLLRSLLMSSSLTSELPTLSTEMKKNARLLKDSDTFATKDQIQTNQRNFFACQIIKRHLLMAFLFQSATGFSVGNKLLAMATQSQDVSSQVTCFIYHFQALTISPELWTSAKRSNLKSLVHYLNHQLEEKNELDSENVRQIQEELKCLLDCLK